MTARRVLVVGGGTAGHVLPAVPVIQSLLEQDFNVHFVGSRSGLEQRLLADLPVQFHAIFTGKLRRYWSWRNFTDVVLIALGVLQSVALVWRIKPHVVFSKGGFVSFPAVFAAWLLRVPVVAHESDLTPGLANKLVDRFVHTLCISFAQTEQRLSARPDRRVVHTGTPVRRQILDGQAAAGRTQLALEEGRRLLVVTGGSLGADALNGVVRDSVGKLADDFFIFHVCGAGKLANLSAENYVEVEYVSDGWGDILAAADVVISRAGANALFELLALRKLNVLVPLSAKASRGDQIQNAQFAEAAGFSVVVPEDELTPASLQVAVAQVVADEAEYRAALDQFVVPQATAAIVKEILAVTNSEQ